MTRRISVLLLTGLLVWTGMPCAPGNVIIEWNQAVLQATRVGRTDPPRATRNFAKLHTAIFDAVNAIDKVYDPYHIEPEVAPGTSREAAVAAAAKRILTDAFPTQSANFAALMNTQLDAIADGPGKDAGIELGLMVAEEMIRLRSNDGANATVAYATSSAPGRWRETPPGFLPPLLPHWGRVTCWVMRGGAQFRPPDRPALTDEEYTRDFNEVKELGARNSTVRTPEQSEIAVFWADGAGTETPPGHWNHIAQHVAIEQGLSLVETARLFALLNVALADAAICSWDAKYAYNDWRPVTGIREAARDGNPLTVPDPTWESFIVTPPFPSYTSGHSTFSGAASTILAALFWDQYAFTSVSDGLPGVTRSFESFSQAAEEASNSRIYGGIHWRYDCTVALQNGRDIAALALRTTMRLRGDANGDGVVDAADVLALQKNWGKAK